MADEKNEQLTEPPEEPTIEPSEDTGAGHVSSEDTLKGIIAKQNGTIDTLTDQIESLNAQIAKLVRSSGSQVEGANTDNGFEDDDPTSREDYVYLKDLGAEIGKRDY